VRDLTCAGVREVTLLGQNVNAYHGRDQNGAPAGLSRLIAALSKIEALARIRYTTSHPRDMDDGLIAEHALNSKLMPYLHLPVQSGSDAMLAAMNRRHTVADYLRIIDRLRAAVSNIALSSDFIVGFPGETDADFAATLDLVREVEFAQAYSFKYSSRPGTPAADLDGQIDEAVKSERLARLQALLGQQQRAFNDTCIGRTLPLLLDKPGRRPGQLIGRSPYLQSVHVDAGDAEIGDVVSVEIVAASANSLTGQRGAPAPLTAFDGAIGAGAHL